jgi:hypothetical protein
MGAGGSLASPVPKQLISSAGFAAAMAQVMRKQPGPLSGGRISGERVPAEDCRCQHGLFSGLKCLYWQREWGDVPKAITEAIVVVQRKP